MLREIFLFDNYSQFCPVWVDAPRFRTPFFHSFPFSAPESWHFSFPSQKGVAYNNKAVISEKPHFYLWIYYYVEILLWSYVSMVLLTGKKSCLSVCLSSYV